jgi:hypothetical protein
MKQLHHNPALIYRDGKPIAVMLEIEEYLELLEKLEDYQDIAYIEEVKRQRPLEYTTLEEYLRELGIEEE